MPRRPPRLPMLLGLAALTGAAHVLAAVAHFVGGHAEWRDGPLLVLLALAPLAGLALAMWWDRPRHGAALYALTMAAAGAWTLWSHFVAAGDAAEPLVYAWIVQMLLAFELQGVALGAMLVVRPQAPRRPTASGA